MCSSLRNHHVTTYFSNTQILRHAGPKRNRSDDSILDDERKLVESRKIVGKCVERVSQTCSKRVESGLEVDGEYVVKESSSLESHLCSNHLTHTRTHTHTQVPSQNKACRKCFTMHTFGFSFKRKDRTHRNS